MLLQFVVWCCLVLRLVLDREVPRGNGPPARVRQGASEMNSEQVRVREVRAGDVLLVDIDAAPMMARDTVVGVQHIGPLTIIDFVGGYSTPPVSGDLLVWRVAAIEHARGAKVTDEIAGGARSEGWECGCWTFNSATRSDGARCGAHAVTGIDDDEGNEGR